MKTLILLLLVFELSGYAQEGWFQQNSGTNENLRSVFFINKEIGWIVGYNGTILNTKDGGKNWVNQFSGTTQNLLSVFFIDSANGWCVGISGTILHTTNSGLSWTSQYFNTNNWLTSVYFTNIDTGIVAGGGLILRTTDSGNNWVGQDTMNYPIWSVHFADSKTGWVGCTLSIQKTTNAGISWVQQQFSSIFFYSVFCIDSLTAWVAAHSDIYPGPGGYLFKTIDGGEYWSIYLIRGNFFRPYSIYFADRENGWAVGVEGFVFPFGDGLILKTSNGGVNWVSQDYDTNDFLYSVYFTNSNIGWVVGDSGKVFKTFNGGIITEMEEIVTESPSDFLLSQNHPNPFNPITNFEYRIPNSEFVTLKVYDVLGNEIATLINEEKTAGNYEVEFNAVGTSRDLSLPSGIYFYRLVAGNFVETKKMILMK